MVSASHVTSGGYRKMPQQKRLLALISVSYSVLIAVVCSSDDWTPFLGNMKYTNCSFSNAFRQLFHVSFESCIDECLLRRRCSIVQYNNAFKLCILSGHEDYPEIASFSPSELACISANVTGWDTSHLGSCSAHACGLTEKCNIGATYTSEQCQPSECLIPPSLDNARPCSNAYGIGMKNAYCCDKDYNPVGNQSITCLENGTWTDTNFACTKTCSYPKEIPNAKLVQISGDGYVVGSELTFECKPGYMQINGTTLSSECSDRGKWKPGSLGCCKTGYIFDDNRCYITFINTTLTSYTEMKQQCKQSGGRMAGRKISEDLLKQIPGLDLFVVDEQKEDMIADIQTCIINSGTTFNGVTLDEHVQFVRYNGIPCEAASMWAPGEPNGGSDQPCIVMANSFIADGTFTLRDYPCTFDTHDFVYNSHSFACYEKHNI